MKDRNNTLETGDKCTKCSDGRVALALSAICNADMDDEPYKNGVYEGENETITLDECISFVLHVCDNCGYVHSIFIE